MSEPFVYLVMPHRNLDTKLGAGKGYWQASSKLKICHDNHGHSVLEHNFNVLWTNGLNRRHNGLTHFAMQHNDVCPTAGWLDILMAEMDATGADMVGAVVPIKNDRGLTSLAVHHHEDLWTPRRLTMSEVFRLPATFRAEEVLWHGPAYGQLLLNTGLWLVKLGDWCDRIVPSTGQVPTFRVQTRILNVRPGGKDRCPQFIPEDWDWSRQLQELGLTVAATRKVSLYHENPDYHTNGPWGTWNTDLGFYEFNKRLREARAEAADAA